jgi:hypothetical protein
MALTSETVHRVMEACIFGEEPQEDDADALVVEGILHRYAFSRKAIEAHTEEIRGMLAELPEAFHDDIEHGYGGWSFLNLCMDRHGTQWTGFHWVQEQLVSLGIACGKAAWVPPERERWALMPGSLPYVAINLDGAPLPLAHAVKQEEVPTTPN